MGRPRTKNLDLGLPPRVYVEKGTFFYRPKDGPSESLGTTLAEMRRRYEKLRGRRMVGWEDQSLATALMRKCRARARAYGFPCMVTAADIEALMIESKGRCAVSGIPFDTQERGIGRRRPWAPSVDRIDNAKGYEPGNLRLVCVAVNIALSDFGEDVLLEIARRMVKKYSARNIRCTKNDQTNTPTP